MGMTYLIRRFVGHSTMYNSILMDLAILILILILSSCFKAIFLFKNDTDRWINFHHSVKAMRFLMWLQKSFLNFVQCFYTDNIVLVCAHTWNNFTWLNYRYKYKHLTPYCLGSLIPKLTWCAFSILEHE